MDMDVFVYLDLNNVEGKVFIPKKYQNKSEKEMIEFFIFRNIQKFIRREPKINYKYSDFQIIEIENRMGLIYASVTNLKSKKNITDWFMPIQLTAAKYLNQLLWQ